jgi:hypothetical protein
MFQTLSAFGYIFRVQFCSAVLFLMALLVCFGYIFRHHLAQYPALTYNQLDIIRRFFHSHIIIPHTILLVLAIHTLYRTIFQHYILATFGTVFVFCFSSLSQSHTILPHYAFPLVLSCFPKLFYFSLASAYAISTYSVCSSLFLYLGLFRTRLSFYQTLFAYAIATLFYFL